MQDRFKVRAWYNRLQEYDYNIQNVVMADSKECFITFFRYVERGNTDVILEQCTGCRDCSNQLIYEGDILEIAEDMGTSHVVVRWDNEFQKWAVEGDTEADYEFYDLVKRPCDTNELVDDVGVVGNIHENPELLEDNK